MVEYHDLYFGMIFLELGPKVVADKVALVLGAIPTGLPRATIGKTRLILDGQAPTGKNKSVDIGFFRAFLQTRK